MIWVYSVTSAYIQGMSIDICKSYRMHITVYHNIICTSTLNQSHESTHAMIWHTEKGRVLQTWHIISYNIIPEATAHPIFALLSLVLWQGPEGCQHLIVQSHEGALVVLLGSMLGSGGVSSHRSLTEFASCQGCPGAYSSYFIQSLIFPYLFTPPFLSFLAALFAHAKVGLVWVGGILCALYRVQPLQLPCQAKWKASGKVSRSNRTLHFDTRQTAQKYSLRSLTSNLWLAVSAEKHFNGQKQKVKVEKWLTKA